MKITLEREVSEVYPVLSRIGKTQLSMDIMDKVRRLLPK